MFAKPIIGSARFLRMPSTSRLLYYDLGMQADDDGVVEAFSVMRTTGATDDDLRVLASKGFIAVLNEDLVSYITDWSRNNLIKRDRYRQSIYKDLIVKISDGTQAEPEWNPSGTQVEPQVRLGKDRIGKGSIGEKETEADKPPRFVPPSVEQVRSYCQERGNRVDPQAFVDFYTSKGWKVGRDTMKDWTASVRTWERRDGGTPEKRGPRKYHMETIDGEEVVVYDD